MHDQVPTVLVWPRLAFRSEIVLAPGVYTFTGKLAIVQCDCDGAQMPQPGNSATSIERTQYYHVQYRYQRVCVVVVQYIWLRFPPSAARPALVEIELARVAHSSLGH